MPCVADERAGDGESEIDQPEARAGGELGPDLQFAEIG